MSERIAELEARVAELREALEDLRSGIKNAWILVEIVLSRPDNFSALNEARAKEWEVAADWIDDETDAWEISGQMRARAREIREGK